MARMRAPAPAILLELADPHDVVASVTTTATGRGDTLVEAVVEVRTSDEGHLPRGRHPNRLPPVEVVGVKGRPLRAVVAMMDP